jgi:hypothetical protein
VRVLGTPDRTFATAEMPREEEVVVPVVLFGNPHA